MSATEQLWGPEVARDYDEASAFTSTPEVLGPTVDFLARRAADGAALELAVGTGRVALPLSARGVPVAGVELSEHMAARLREKPGADAVPVAIGDMASATAPGCGGFRLVYLVYNTITNLLTQDEQVACFRNAARHLEPGGVFVVEVFVPPLQRLPPGQTAIPFHVGEHHVGVDTIDVLNQRLVSHHYRVRDGAGSLFRSPHRWVWPSELDLMARLAGMEPAGRWADWDESPFTAASTSHVSAWRLPGR
ncbi:class I SAM-dependent methyltransferase [Paenibacillus sp. TRM 82003]|uniref:methyltransferase domain-containing protein n=1 Tax=Kineococcus sp. TRM81007 TaxID=2925831 RepID=UPI001F574E1B|nr:class I SAM-dependent methyltransferase [Kineococcus sp. TRM81007]MCI2239991.1 class I SAM-dependent methyltransferase [Kineococcus sp. TRM81007]MCI3925704.1 class I SAM-dependent methyltransferase [Paenibacillus sp. TRM 82003]